MHGHFIILLMAIWVASHEILGDMVNASVLTASLTANKLFNFISPFRRVDWLVDTVD